MQSANRGFLVVRADVPLEREQMTFQMMRAWHSTSCAFIIETPIIFASKKLAVRGNEVEPLVTWKYPSPKKDAAVVPNLFE